MWRFYGFLLLAASSSFAQSPDGLPDFSRAGYRDGLTPPRIREARAVSSIEELRAALSTGGAVRLPAGRFELREPLLIQRNGVVVQGAGSGRTILLCPRSLSDVYGPKRQWSHSGGMVRMRPGNGPTTTVAEVSAITRMGGRRVPVRFKAGIEIGEWLELLWFNDKGEDTLLDHLYGGVIDRNRMGKELQLSTSARVRRWVQVAAIGPDFLVLHRPLPLDVRPEWKPVFRRRPHLRNCGIEGVTFEFPKTKYAGHLKEKGYNAVEVVNAIDCWVRDVRIRNADSGIFVNQCTRVTVSDIDIAGRTMHHCISASWSSDCLFLRWRIAAPHIHGTTISWSAHQNVFAHGRGNALAMDAHRATPFRNLHTAIVVEHGKLTWNPLRSSGSWPRGPHAARGNVYWNVENRYSGEGEVVIRGHADWPLGVFVGWRGNRPLQMVPITGLKQRVDWLNRECAVPDLYAHQRRLNARDEK